jgi:hypothetical protein
VRPWSFIALPSSAKPSDKALAASISNGDLAGSKCRTRAASHHGSKDDHTNIAPSDLVKKRAKPALKEFPPHEHFGSPLNVCRVCGQKYTYVEKPIGPFPVKKH